MKKYSEYKTFNSKSLTSIPKHWSFNKFKRVSYMKGRIGWQGLKQSEFLEDKTLPFLITGMNFKEGLIRWDEVYHITEDRYEEAPEIQLKKGDVLMTKDGTIGKLLFINELPGKASLNSHLLVFRPLKNEYNTRYLYYQLQTEYFFDHVELTKTGTTFFGISQEACGQYIIILPPEKEQIQIANYLDHKTAQIDNLIAKKEQFITLLQEERTAVINQAVTKGLDTKVKMKDSGIEWLGEIPEHWEITKIKYQFNVQGGGTPSKENPSYWNGDIPWVSPKDMKQKEIIDTIDKTNLLGISNSASKIVEAESLLMVVRSGILQRTIPIGINKLPVSLNQDIKSFTSKGNHSINLLYYFIKGWETQLLEDWTKEGATVESIEMEYLLNFPLPMPSSNEQRDIVRFMESEEKRVLTIINKAQQEIELLKEYKTALISEVVTGKVDVRDVVLN
jgi:type I restriction enzyme S subunit